MSAICVSLCGGTPLQGPSAKRSWRSVSCQAISGPDVRVNVGHGPRNSRFVFASLDVMAPVDNVWSSLTDYDNLDDFIPSLAENECLERKPTGAILKQVGQQKIALGVKFCASVILEIGEHLEGLSRDLCWTQSNGRDWDEKLWFPSPGYIDGPSPRDITFDLIRGDFQAFKGLWRMQHDWQTPEVTRLSYSVFIRPQLWLPVGLIQGRISSEAKSNLRAVKRHVEGNGVLCASARDIRT